LSLVELIDFSDYSLDDLRTRVFVANHAVKFGVLQMLDLGDIGGLQVSLVAEDKAFEPELRMLADAAQDAVHLGLDCSHVAVQLQAQLHAVPLHALDQSARLARPHLLFKLSAYETDPIQVYTQFQTSLLILLVDFIICKNQFGHHAIAFFRMRLFSIFGIAFGFRR